MRVGRPVAAYRGCIALFTGKLGRCPIFARGHGNQQPWNLAGKTWSHHPKWPKLFRASGQQGQSCAATSLNMEMACFFRGGFGVLADVVSDEQSLWAQTGCGTIVILGFTL